jgi:hypothetical protein
MAGPAAGWQWLNYGLKAEAAASDTRWLFASNGCLLPVQSEFDPGYKLQCSCQLCAGCLVFSRWLLTADAWCCLGEFRATVAQTVAPSTMPRKEHLSHCCRIQKAALAVPIIHKHANTHVVACSLANMCVALQMSAAAPAATAGGHGKGAVTQTMFNACTESIHYRYFKPCKQAAAGSPALPRRCRPASLCQSAP